MKTEDLATSIRKDRRILKQLVRLVLLRIGIVKQSPKERRAQKMKKDVQA